MKPIGVAILGGTGFGAGELLRYLAFHPEVEVESVVSRSSAGEAVTTHHPHLAPFYSLNLDATPNWERLCAHPERVLFLSLPHGEALRALETMEDTLVRERIRVIDLSADLRLHEKSAHESTYPEVPFDSSWRKRARYSIPEIHGRKLGDVAVISNPGCLATACALAAAPLLTAFPHELAAPLCFDAKTGTSGAGRALSATMHHPNRYGNFEAYKVLEHRHEVEIREALALPEEIPTMFVPHLLPVARGIFVTLYTTLRTPRPLEEMREIFRRYFARAPLVRVREGSPRLSDLCATPFCDISVTVRGVQVVVMAALDNLGKGMASQAIQNMNLALGRDECTGLRIPGMGIL